MKKVICLLMLFCSAAAFAQVDKKEVRKGNRSFRKGEYSQAELEYCKALLKDSLSIAGRYNLASALYKQQDYDEAAEALGETDAEVEGTQYASDYYYNEGDVALQRKDYSAAVKAFRQSLLFNPGDMDAKENYIYAKEMLKNQQNGGGGQNNQDRNQDQDQNRNQDQNQDQDQDDQQNQPQPQDGRQNEQSGGISQQQARQMLRAVQAKEKETQDKVNKEKAALLKSSKKDKNW